MSNNLRDQIFNELSLRETEDLLEIWYAKDHEEYSDVAFEVIEEILTSRMGKIPPREDVFDETQDEEEDTNGNGLEEWEIKLLDDENQPEFYDTLEVLNLKDNINRTMKAAIFVYVLTGLTSVPYISYLVRPFFLNQPGHPLMYIIAFVISMLSSVIGLAVIYFPLKALSSILRILMEMEFRSRKAG